MLILAVMLQTAQSDDARVAAMLAQSRARTRAEVPCGATANPNEIIVCARRDADRYRVPFTTRVARDLPGQRMARLTQDTSPPCGEGAFLVHCGMVGLSATVSAAGTRVEVPRELAP